MHIHYIIFVIIAGIGQLLLKLLLVVESMGGIYFFETQWVLSTSAKSKG